ncbi:MAG: 2-hydroxyacyl-CoA dehydratase, partial [Eubacteriales bacterium]|nr:2-hydroxyacyl-CoA dehydratase [Eubacteriales bacterium]
TYGYNAVLLDDRGKNIKELGLRYVHNDTCYPALLVIGQFIEALQSGNYDENKVALLLTQTGGGCRASNYLALLRKALAKAGYPQVPVISFNVVGMEKNPGFKITLPLLHRLMYAAFYGDLLMLLRNQCKPYEINSDESERLAERWTDTLTAQMAQNRILYKKVKENYTAIIKDFESIPKRTENKIKVGIVGEIFVKFSPLGNNHLEDFLFSEGAEVVMPGLVDFCLYVVYDGIVDYKLYNIRWLKSVLTSIVYKIFIKKQQDIIDLITKNSSFMPPTSFEKTRTLTKDYIGLGAKMGEGWLLCAEMLELVEQGVNNIVCTQPFGCLPNHIMGKGMMKPIRERHSNVNIVAIDYDPGATNINQENRIKLMLSNAKERQYPDTENQSQKKEETLAGV